MSWKKQSLVTIALLSPLHSATFFGPEVKTAFASEATANGTIEDFDSSPQRFSSLASLTGVTFESNITTSGNPTTGLPVVRSFFANRAGTIVGTPFASGTDDGRMGYQILFDNPQRWVGLQRYWSAETVTQFYNSNGVLLGEFTGEPNPFVGFIADSADQTTWVSRVQLDGRRTSDPAMTRQVGYSDDLMFGTSDFTLIPEPSSSALVLTALLCGSFRRQGK